MIVAKEHRMTAANGRYITDTQMKYANVLSVVRENNRYYSSGIDDPGDVEYRKILGSSDLEFKTGVSAADDVSYESVRIIFKI